MKIKNRIMIAFLAMVALVFGYLYYRVDRTVRPVYLQSIEDDLVEVATLLSSLMELYADGKSLDVNVLRQLTEYASGRELHARIYDRVKTKMDLRVYVMDASGKVVFDSQNLAEGRDFSGWRDVKRTLDGEYGARATWMTHQDQRVLILHVASPIIVDDDIIGVVSVGKPTPVAYSFFRRVRAEAFWAVTLAILFIAAWGFAVTLWITRPIEKLITYAEITRDGGRMPLPKLGNSDIGELGRAFEKMTEALEGKKYVEQYVQNLTHEIKSPLSGIKGTAELLDEDMDTEQRQQFLTTLASESDRIERIIDRMLELSSLESRKELRDATRFNLRALVNEVLQRMAPQIQAKSLNVRVGNGDVTVFGERSLVRLALANIIQNAIDFSPPHTQITIDFGDAGVSVRDQGPGIPQYAETRITQRFYSLKRPDTGRKSSGLGLSIVKEIAELHDGHISVRNATEGGTEAVIQFGRVDA